MLRTPRSLHTISAPFNLSSARKAELRNTPVVHYDQENTNVDIHTDHIHSHPLMSRSMATPKKISTKTKGAESAKMATPLRELVIKQTGTEKRKGLGNKETPRMTMKNKKKMIEKKQLDFTCFVTTPKKGEIMQHDDSDDDIVFMVILYL